MTKNTEVAVAETAGLPTTFDYGQDAGVGFEGTKGSDLSVPFLAILQSNSPQVVDKDPKGSESGMFFNTVTKEIFPAVGADEADGLVFIPCHKETAFVEWVPRDSGGGFVGLHDPNGKVVAQAIEDNDGSSFGKLMVGENNLVETYYVYGLFLNPTGEETLGFAVLSFSSTKITPYRDWITAMYTLKGKPPMFANRARLKTVKQKNDYGTFYNFRIEPFASTWVESLINPTTQPDLLTEAKEFRDMVLSGMARADFASQKAAEGSGSSGDGGDGGKGGDAEDAPF